MLLELTEAQNAKLVRDYDSLKTQLEEYRAVLEWYGDDSNFDLIDGKRAQEVLKKYEGKNSPIGSEDGK